jgi:hypothetical protein
VKHWLILLAVLVLCLPGVASAGNVVLSDWDGYQNNGADFNPSGGPVAIPASVNTSAFNFSTGIGSVTFSFTTPGAHDAAWYEWPYYDSGFGDTIDAYGNGVGSAPAGLTWEMADGNTAPLWTDFYGNALTSSSSATTYSAPPAVCCDVQLAEVFGFTANPNVSIATVTFTMSAAAPSSGFYLQTTDNDSATSLYMTSSFSETDNTGNTAPEPASLLTIVGGLALLSAARWRKTGR